MTKTKKGLSRSEAEELERREASLARRLSGSLDQFEAEFQAGEALLAIRDQKLWRAGYRHFRDYLHCGQAMSAAYGYFLLNGARCRMILATSSTGGRSHVMPPQSVRQVRDIAGLPPGLMRRAWRIAIKSAGGGQPSPDQIRAARDKVTAEQESDCVRDHSGNA